MTYTASDATSGLADVELWAKGPSDGAFALVATDTGVGIDFTFPYTASQGDGTYEFYTRAHDLAGNYEDAPGGADDSTIVDTVNPSSAACSPAFDSDGTFAVTYTASWTRTSGLADVELWAKGPSDGAFALVATDTGVGIDFTFPYTASQGDGTYEFYTRAHDLAGNYEDAPGGADDSTIVDTLPPTVLSINRLSPPSPTNSSSLTFRVTFSEDVTGVGVTDFVLTLTGTLGDVADEAVDSVSLGGGSVYDVTVSTVTGDGTIRLDLDDNESIEDLANNGLGGPGPDNGDWTGDELFTNRPHGPDNDHHVPGAPWRLQRRLLDGRLRHPRRTATSAVPPVIRRRVACSLT